MGGAVAVRLRKAVPAWYSRRACAYGLGGVLRQPNVPTYRPGRRFARTSSACEVTGLYDV